MQLPSNYFSFQRVSLRLPCFNLYWGTSPVLFPPVDCTCFPASHCFLIIFTFAVSDDLAAFPYSALWSTVLCDMCTHSYLVHYHKPGESFLLYSSEHIQFASPWETDQTTSYPSSWWTGGEKKNSSWELCNDGFDNTCTKHISLSASTPSSLLHSNCITRHKVLHWGRKEGLGG